MSDKIKVYHFHNGSVGGVLTVIRNLLKYKEHADIEYHVIYTINRETITSFQPFSLEGAETEQVFYYSPKWNFYHTCKQLSKLFPSDAILIAHDWLELGMVSHLGLSNKVIHLLHGDYSYYYDLVNKHAHHVDVYFCVSDAILHKINSIRNDITDKLVRFYIPVSEVKKKLPYYHTHSIVFVGRCEKSKGYHLLPLIALELLKLGVSLEWHIYGEQLDKTVLWDSRVKVSHHGTVNNAYLLKKLENYDYFILPSVAEGMPVTLIEAMKVGLIPLVNNISGALELIQDGLNGFVIDENNIEEYVKKIFQLECDLQAKEIISDVCSRSIDHEFNLKKSVSDSERHILKLNKEKCLLKPKLKTYGSRLDRNWIPNFLTSSLRTFLNQTK